jgi:hypothetical protein
MNRQLYYLNRLRRTPISEVPKEGSLRMPKNVPLFNDPKLNKEVRFRLRAYDEYDDEGVRRVGRSPHLRNKKRVREGGRVERVALPTSKALPTNEGNKYISQLYRDKELFQNIKLNNLYTINRNQKK